MLTVTKERCSKEINLHSIVRHISVVLVFFIAIGASAARSQGYSDLPLDDELRDEIRAILDAGSGQIRRWDRPPTVAVVYRDD